MSHKKKSRATKHIFVEDCLSPRVGCPTEPHQFNTATGECLPSARPSYVWNGVTIYPANTKAPMKPTPPSKPKGSTVGDSK